MDYHHLQGRRSLENELNSFFWIVSEQRIRQLNLNLIVLYTFRHLECK